VGWIVRDVVGSDSGVEVGSLADVVCWIVLEVVVNDSGDVVGSFVADVIGWIVREVTDVEDVGNVGTHTPPLSSYPGTLRNKQISHSANSIKRRSPLTRLVQCRLDYKLKRKHLKRSSRILEMV
jgi:hypothetical protein